MSDPSCQQSRPSRKSLGRVRRLWQAARAKHPRFEWWARICSEEPWLPGHADYSRWHGMWNDHNVAACRSVYQPLDAEHKQIRVLRVMYDENSAELICSLQTISLDYDVRYTCLSYAWENTGARRPIWLNRQLYLITTSLYNALIGLFRKGDGDTYIWADGLCINQHDLAEREKQVALMASVYSQAADVQAWVGQGDTDIDEAMSIIERADDYSAEQLLKYLDHPRWEKLAELPWFSRLWVVQESLLAKHLYLHYGERTLYWGHFEDFGYRLAYRLDREFRLRFRHNIDALGRVYNYMTLTIGAFNHQYKSIWKFTASDANKLIVFLDDARTKLATELRDHVYCLLGLLPPAIGIEVRYNDPVVTVFKDATLALIRWGKSLSWLQVANTLSDPSFPTWCIYFAGRPTRTLSARVGRAVASCRGAKLSLQCHANEALLELAAIFVEPVAQVCGPFTYSHQGLVDPCVYLPRLRECYDLAEKLGHAGDQNRAESQGRLWRTLLMDEMTDKEYETKQCDLHSLPLADLERWVATGGDLPASAEDLISYHLVLLARKSFFVTSSGRFGVAFQLPEPGDKIAVLAGLEWPVLLRESQWGSKTVYGLVGFCYCEDIMDGEAVPAAAENMEGDSLLEHGFEMISLV